MAKVITPLDAHALMDAIYEQATGKQNVTSTSTADFVSVGESVLSTGIENTMNALTIVFADSFVNVKPYGASFTVIEERDAGLYKTRSRRISFYDKGSKEAGWVNTDSHSKNLYNGYDNGINGGDSVGSMWEQDKPVAVEFFFGGMETYDFEITYYPEQLKVAFTSPEEFAKFWNGLLVNKQNEMEQYREAKNRSTLLNYLAGIYDLSASMPLSSKDMVAAYNTKFGTNYTGSDLRSTYLASFTAFVIATITKDRKYMAKERTLNYHWSPSVTRDGVTYDKLLHHCPMEDQKLVLLEEMWDDAETLVLPQIFHNEALTPDKYEGVTYWQGVSNRGAINITPAIPDVSDPTSQTTGAAVNLPYVIGVLFDRDACITSHIFEGADSSPVEARKKYRNEWIHTAFQSVNDFTLPGILYYMAS